MVADFAKKQKGQFFSNKALFKTFGIIFLLVIFALLVADFKIYQKKKELLSQISAYQKQIEDIEKSSQTLKDEITNADNPDYLEKIAYEQLGQQKPGEKQIIFVMPEDKPKEAPKQQNFWDIKSWTGWLTNGFDWLKSKF